MFHEEFQDCSKSSMLPCITGAMSICSQGQVQVGISTKTWPAVKSQRSAFVQKLSGSPSRQYCRCQHQAQHLVWRADMPQDFWANTSMKQPSYLSLSVTYYGGLTLIFIGVWITNSCRLQHWCILTVKTSAFVPFWRTVPSMRHSMGVGKPHVLFPWRNSRSIVVGNWLIRNTPVRFDPSNPLMLISPNKLDFNIAVLKFCVSMIMQASMWPDFLIASTQVETRCQNFDIWSP